jgi:hypothetical protein
MAPNNNYKTGNEPMKDALTYLYIS